MVISTCLLEWDTRLHVVSFIDDRVTIHDFTLVEFLDIEDDIKDINSRSIINALELNNIYKDVSKWI